jgi:hypothetical protein
MPTYRVHKSKDNPYVMMNKKFLSDERLSYKAKGILSYLLSKPDDWKVYENDLVNQSEDGKTAVRSGLKELEEYDYIQKIQTRTKDGKFDGYNYDVFEQPMSQKLYNKRKDTGAENPKTGNPKSDNHKVVNNELELKNEETNKLNTTYIRLTSYGSEYLNLYNRIYQIHFNHEHPKINEDKISWMIDELVDISAQYGFDYLEKLIEYHMNECIEKYSPEISWKKSKIEYFITVKERYMVLDNDL